LNFAKMCSIVRDMRDSGALTTRELADANEVCWDTAYYWVRVMQAEGLIRRTPEGKWVLAEVGSPAWSPYRAGKRR
jgi:hypothetical protein